MISLLPSSLAKVRTVTIAIGFGIYLHNRYNKGMIVSFRDKKTAKVYRQEFSKKLPQAIQRLALRKLMMIDNASSLNDLRIPPANHLE